MNCLKTMESRVLAAGSLSSCEPYRNNYFTSLSKSRLQRPLLGPEVSSGLQSPLTSKQCRLQSHLERYLRSHSQSTLACRHQRHPGGPPLPTRELHRPSLPQTTAGRICRRIVGACLPPATPCYSTTQSKPMTSKRTTSSWHKGSASMRKPLQPSRRWSRT